MVRKLTSVLWLSFCLPVLLAQQPVDRGSLYKRILCVVPMVGSGTFADPKRPMFAPLPAEIGADRNGILGYQFQASDDGKFALVEFVAGDHSAFAPIRGAHQPQVQVFERGKSTRQQVEAVFKKFKRDFSFDQFQPVRVQ